MECSISERRMNSGIEFLRKLSCDSVPHSRRTLLEHLIGTHDMLHAWGAPEHVRLAGLFHSIYGTEGFSATLAELPQREIIAAIIGTDAETLAWLFGIKTSKSFWEQVRMLSGGSGDNVEHMLLNRITGAKVPCSKNQMMRLVDLALANEIEQAQHIPEHYTESKRAALRSLLPHSLPAAAATFAKTFGAV